MGRGGGGYEVGWRGEIRGDEWGRQKGRRKEEKLSVLDAKERWTDKER